MSRLSVQLFGKLSIQRDQEDVPGLESQKVQELFCYLLLHRRSHPREALADILWGGGSTAQARKYLRQALWYLQAALGAPSDPASPPILSVEADWVRLRPDADLSLDVAAFEEALAHARETPGAQLDQERARALEAAVGLYRGDLLAGWYQDWVLFDRERLQNIYIAMLSKLVAYCHRQHRFEAGLAYGEQILQLDSARESAHRWLMRLYYETGERTEALRQYDRCVAALERELSIRPSSRTTALYEWIRADRGDDGSVKRGSPAPFADLGPLQNALTGLHRLQLLVGELDWQLGKDIELIELGLAQASVRGDG